MTNVIALTETYKQLYPTCKILPSKQKEVEEVAGRLCENRAKMAYLNVENIIKSTMNAHVPWWFIAVVHEREASQAWWANIAQGDPWNRVSRHVPRGMGPYKSWQDAALAALTKTPVGTLRRVSDWRDWSIGGALVVLEMYNGFGYENFHHERSPYIWAATTLEEWGKYIQDGVWSSHVWDQQLGCAAMLKQMQVIDPSITTEMLVT